jgi:hypothetical protein
MKIAVLGGMRSYRLEMSRRRSRYQYVAAHTRLSHVAFTSLSADCIVDHLPTQVTVVELATTLLTQIRRSEDRATGVEWESLAVFAC